jgi:hypothetical protein
MRVVWYYLNDDAPQTLQTVLAGLIHQLLKLCPKIPVSVKHAARLFARCQLQPSMDRMQNLLIECARNQHDTIWIVLDAVDRCDKSLGRMPTLVSHLLQASKHCRILISLHTENLEDYNFSKPMSDYEAIEINPIDSIKEYMRHEFGAESLGDEAIIKIVDDAPGRSFSYILK